MSQLIKPRSFVLSGVNPISKGLVFAAEFISGGSNTVFDLASKQSASVSGTIAWQDDLYGKVGVLNRSQYINFPNATPYSVTNACSIQALVNLGNTNPNNEVISKRSAFSSTGIPFELNCDAQTITARFIGNGTHITTGNINTTGVWYNIISTWDGTTQNLYRNGLNVGSTPLTGVITPNTATITIGGLPSAGGELFGGSIAFVRVWNRGLASSEAMSLTQNPFQIYARQYFPYANVLSVATGGGMQMGRYWGSPI